MSWSLSVFQDSGAGCCVGGGDGAWAAGGCVGGTCAGETSLLAGLIVMAVVEAFVTRGILILWQAQMEVEAAVVMLVLWSLVVMAVVEVFEPR